MTKRPFVIFFGVLCALLILYLSILGSIEPSAVPQPVFLAVQESTQSTPVAKKHMSATRNFKVRPTKTDKHSQTSAETYQASTTTPPASSKRPPISRKGPEIRQVILAKVHKAASSTMQNIFLRFALSRNLSLLLPRKGTSISEHSKYFGRESIVPHPQGKQFYDILCSHVIFDERQLSKYFPETAVRVAIVREPLEQSLSALKYYLTNFPTPSLNNGLNKHKEDPINGFFRNPKHFYSGWRGPSASHINNRMSVDLGFDLDAFEASKKNKTKIHAFLRQVEDQFDMVLVSDYFDESLVLMRRVLRWPMKDIIYLKVNVAKTNVNPVWRKRLILNSTLARKFREWDEIDFQLYDHFQKVFSETIQREPFFQEELKAFRTIQMDVKYFCVYEKTSDTLRIPKSDWTDEFTISKSKCELMSLSESSLTNLARTRQLKRYEAFSRKTNKTPPAPKKRIKHSSLLAVQTVNASAVRH
ncbi:hypothetical protein RRG08_013900 [Elysia crispata]|uniref:Uncharacterized protein n=1 Tax=Elysia crispata TaxID=231223 RepID=A0AAE1CLI7_9GAST|nr:hypothetical protein RRG08_013900 [Elysia crispata]